jgi:hypothetical protein
VEGPLSVLRRCYSERRQVQIYTRHRRGLRGSATGFLKAFDKYMNMVRGAGEMHVRGMREGLAICRSHLASVMTCVRNPQVLAWSVRC